MTTLQTFQRLFVFGRRFAQEMWEKKSPVTHKVMLHKLTVERSGPCTVSIRHEEVRSPPYVGPRAVLIVATKRSNPDWNENRTPVAHFSEPSWFIVLCYERGNITVGASRLTDLVFYNLVSSRCKAYDPFLRSLPPLPYKGLLNLVQIPIHMA
jgi:hypothetical protein